MSNKLYTEQQVRIMLGKARIHNMDDTEMFTDDYLIEQQIPIELPSDEEIDNEGWEYQVISGTGDDRFIHFREGAKWMRDEIQGGGK